MNYFAQRIPADVRARAVGQSLAVPLGEFTQFHRISAKAHSVRFSLRTRDPTETKLRQAAATAYLRDSWLYPPELVRWEPEAAEGYPNRAVPVDERASEELEQRTLANLYSRPPAWLRNANRSLDSAVALAYGWPTDLPDDQIVSRLLALNLERSNQGSPRSSATRLLAVT